MIPGPILQQRPTSAISTNVLDAAHVVDDVIGRALFDTERPAASSASKSDSSQLAVDADQSDFAHLAGLDS